MNYDPGCYTLECTWNPTSGKLYQSYYTPGFIFNDKPVYPSGHDLIIRGHYKFERIPHGDIFMYIGGPGGKQRCPGHFVAFKVLWGERLGWLIYPEQYMKYDSRPVDPIRL